MGVEKVRRPLLAERDFTPEQLHELQVLLGMGHALYADGAARLEADAVTIAAGTRTKLTIDALGPQTETTWANGLVGWDPVENVQPLDTDGESFDWRVTFFIKKTAASTDQKLLFEQDIGGAVGPIFSRTTLLGKAQDEVQECSFGWPGYGKDTFRANGGAFYVTPTTNIALWGTSFFVRRDFKPVPGHTY